MSNLSDQDKIGFLEGDVSNLEKTLLKTNIEVLRLQKTLNHFAENMGAIVALADAMRKTMVDEKTALLKLIVRQKSRLDELKAPPIIIDSKNEDAIFAEEVLRDITNESSKDFMTRMNKEYWDLTMEIILDISTNFCSGVTTLLEEDELDPKNQENENQEQVEPESHLSNYARARFMK